MFLFTSLSDSTARQNSPCSPMFRPRKASGRSVAQPVKWLVTFLPRGCILPFSGSCFHWGGGAFFCGSSLLGSSNCKSELLKNLSCSYPWSHSMEMWMWDFMIWRTIFLGTFSLHFRGAEVTSKMQVTQLAWTVGGGWGTHAQPSLKRDS